MRIDETQAELLEMLEFRRPHGSKTEKTFIRKFITPLGVKFDGCGNRFKKIGSAPILWSCHTDTVHRHSGKQRLVRVANLVGQDDEQSNCLGADDALGVWILRQMILAGIEGLYVFHRAEERGGIGSAWIRDTQEEKLKDYRYAIAFDRRNTHSIITHQGGSKTASNEFAKDLADRLDLGHVCDDGGSFTDTANYADCIAECTNVSAGYFFEHTKGEYQDLEYASELLNALLYADLDNLVVNREPGDDGYDDISDWQDERWNSQSWPDNDVSHRIAYAGWRLGIDEPPALSNLKRLK